jgi:hypothetical protein
MENLGFDEHLYTNIPTKLYTINLSINLVILILVVISYRIYKIYHNKINKLT